MTHTVCGNSWETYAIEWPPQVQYCTTCHTPLRLVSHDPVTQRLSYRKF